MRLLLLLIAVFSLVSPVRAHDPIALRASRMLDVESGKVVLNPVIVIDHDRIVGINPDTLPANAELIDLGDRILLPGLIDCHTHLTLDPHLVSGHEFVAESSAETTLRATRNARRTLRAGFTTEGRGSAKPDQRLH